MKKLICCILVVSLCGCISEESETSAESAPAKLPAPSETNAAEKSAKAESFKLQTVELASQTAAVEPRNSLAEVALLSDELRKMLAPLAEGECFFSAPTGRKVQVEVKGEAKVSGTQRDSIRLLGFVQIGSDQPGKSRAILRINGKLNYVLEGDQLDDLEVLSIAAPVVTFQQQRQRWSISLHDQPKSSTDSTGRFVSTRPPERPARQQSGARTNSPGHSTLALQPASSGPAGLTLPALPAPPELPSLPGISPNGANNSNQPNSAAPGGGPSEPAGPQLPQLPQLPDLPGAPELPEMPDELKKDKT